MLYLIKDPRTPTNNRCYLKYLTKEQALICIKEVNDIIRLHNSPKALEVMLIEQKKAVRAMSMYAPKENPLGQTIYYEYIHSNGVPYYFNPKTGEPQWEKPTDGIIEQPPQFDMMNMHQQQATAVGQQQAEQIGGAVANGGMDPQQASMMQTQPMQYQMPVDVNGNPIADPNYNPAMMPAYYSTPNYYGVKVSNIPVEWGSLFV